jgi:hypothetical protein
VKALIAAVILLIVPARAFAAADTWYSGDSGPFNQNNLWSDTSWPSSSSDTAAFNVPGSYTVTFPSLSPTNQDLFVNQGTVTFASSGGPQTYTLTQSGGDSTANLSGGTFTLGTSENPLSIAAANRTWVQTGGTMNVKYGSHLTAANLGLGRLVSGTPSLEIDGSGSQLSANGSSNTLGQNGASGSLTLLNGASGSLGNTNLASSATSGTGNITVQSGATLAIGSVSAGAAGLAGQSATILVTGSGSSITQAAGTNLTLGAASGSTTILNVNGGGSYTVPSTGSTFLYPTGTININGGSASLGTLQANGGLVNLNSGSLSYLGELKVGLGGVLGENLSLDTSKSLTLSGSTTIDPLYKLDLTGGTFSTGSLVSNGTFNFSSGTLGITGAGGLTVGTAGPFGSTFTLSTGRNLNVTNTTTINPGSLLALESGSGFTTGTLANNGELALEGSAATAGGTTVNNAGLIHGEGRITAAVNNNSTGEIRAESGKRLLFSGSNGANAGQINLLGGTAEFNQPLSNASTGTIMGHGTLAVHGTGLTNQGNIAFTTGQTDVFGKVSNQSGAKIVISGGGSTTFYDDVTAAGGTIQVSPGCTAVFFGSYNGGTTGTGTVYNEGDLRPGNSPAAVSFGGQLLSDGRLWIELGGTARGSQYDALEVADKLTLGGTLNVALINGFQPAHNETFDILHFGSRSGDFAVKSGLDLGGRLTLIPQFTPASLILTAAQGGSGTWRFDLSGNASVSTNWSSAIPNGTGDVATLGAVIGTAQTVAVDAPTTLGGITFNNTHRYTLAGPQTITLDNGGAAATIRVDGAGPDGHVISAPLSLASDLLLQVGTGSLTLGGVINDPSGKRIMRLGAGSVFITGSQNYGAGTVLQIGSGGSAPVPAPLPEPATLTLLVIAGVCCLAGWRWRASS